ncbi:MAG TPA: thioredoxin domain-containing protein, partial [Methanomicrobiales archaeon]|nr:thioredoxin domain-containing protein [Methanomicrobiales archaeon]
MVKESDKGKENRLIHEKSPYLLQHAHNPVDWYPWGDEAFERARKEDRPIFLSIGYSTCHWCHVMAEESFEDPEVAKLLSDTFVCIKVDREERPDIDQVYMAVAQTMTGRGGWPLTILMTPDRLPFFAATYIPKESRPGLLGMLDLIPRIREVWKNQRDITLDSAREVLDALQRREEPPGHAEVPGRSLLDETFYALASHYDSIFGGFSYAPKFPSPHYLLF